VAALALENALRFSEAESQARTDELTSLPNTRGLFEHLDRHIAQCRDRSIPLGLLVCDLNNFKKVNDTFGHLAGNALLRGVANTLRTSIRAGDCVARLGGDEFVVVMPETDVATASLQVSRLAEAVAGAAHGSGYPSISMSVGVAVYPDDGLDALALLAAADRRMYAAKASHRTGGFSRGKPEAPLPAEGPSSPNGVEQTRVR
jgi:diguanylate cyclase (GGDEF)-like protein